MPKFNIEASAQFQNIASLTIPEDYSWHISLLCGNCGEKPPKAIVLTFSDTIEGVRGATVHLRMTCKFCGRASDVKILSDQMTYTAEQAPNWTPILLLECRGIEPKEVVLADDEPLIVKGEDGFLFEDALVEDGEFYSYDEKRKVEASITEFKMRIVKN